MKYPEVLTDNYNEVMYDERDVIVGFLNEQKIKTWHFDPAVEMHTVNATIVKVSDVSIDNNVVATFNVVSDFGNEGLWECFDFAYGELRKIIEALPDAKQLANKEIAEICGENTINLEEHPFNTKINGVFTSIVLVDYIDGRVVAYNHDGKIVSDEYTTDFLVGLRDHIRIEVLHSSKEYKTLVEFLSLQPNLYFEPANFGDVEFTREGVRLDLLSACLDSVGALQLCCADGKESTYFGENAIRPEYLSELVSYIEEHRYCDIIDTYNAHNPELVRKINAAWKKEDYHKLFGTILLALLYRDNIEYEEKFGEILDYSEEYAVNHAHEIMEGVCDDMDLETILSFVRYKE